MVNDGTNEVCETPGDSLQLSVGGNHLVLHAPFILPRQHVDLLTRLCVRHSPTVELESFHLRKSCLCSADMRGRHSLTPPPNQNCFFLQLSPPWQLRSKGVPKSCSCKPSQRAKPRGEKQASRRPTFRSQAKCL